MNFNLNPMQVHEISEVVRLVNSAYRGDSSEVGWTTEAAYLDGQRTDEKSLAEEIQNPNCSVFCLRSYEASEIIGSVLLEKYQDEKGPGCYLGMLTVKPTIQMGGLGKWMMQALEEIVRAWGISRITLQVLSPRQELMEWYQRRGYRKTGQTEKFPYGQEQFGLPKTKDLHFVIFEKTI